MVLNKFSVLWKWLLYKFVQLFDKQNCILVCTLHLSISSCVINYLIFLQKYVVIEFKKLLFSSNT